MNSLNIFHSFSDRKQKLLVFLSVIFFICSISFLFVLLPVLSAQQKFNVHKRTSIGETRLSVNQDFVIKGQNRKIIEIQLKDKGQIYVKAEWSGTAKNLSLILNGPGRRSYYARKNGQSPLTLVFDVTSKLLSLREKWRVTVANFDNRTTASGRIEITYPGKRPISKPQVSTGKPQFSIARPKEKLRVVRWSTPMMHKSTPIRKCQLPPLQKAADIQIPTKSFHIKKSKVKVNKRRPIAFKTFPLVDPITEKAVNPDKTFTLPNGQSMSAKVYYDELNKLERGYNELGYSLNIKRDPSLKVKLQEMSISRAAVTQNTQRANKIIAAHKYQNLALPKSVREIQKNFRTRIKDNKDRLRRLQQYKINRQTLLSPSGQQEHPYNYPLQAEKELGYRDVFAIFFSGKTEFSGNSDFVKVAGSAETGAYVIDNKVDILCVDGNITAPSSGGKLKASLIVSIAGVTFDIVDKEESIPSLPLDELSSIPSIEVSEEWSKSLDESYGTVFPLGPIPLSVKVGIRASAGIQYCISLSPLYADAQFGPFVSSNIYAQAGIDLIIVGAGVSCSLTLLDDSLILQVKVGLDADDQKGPYVFAEFSIYDSFEALSGELDFYVYVYVPSWSLPPWKKKYWHWELADWEGYHALGYIVKPTTAKQYLFTGQLESETDEEASGYETTGGIGGIWRPEGRGKKLFKCTSIFSPAPVFFRGWLFEFFTSNAKIYYNHAMLENTLTQKPPLYVNDTIPGFYSITPPAACVYKNYLYVFHKGDDRNIYYRYLDKHLSWWPKLKSKKILINGQGCLTSDRPALVVFKNRLYLFFKKTGDKKIYYTYSYRSFFNPATESDELQWTALKSIPRTTSTTRGPSACVYRREGEVEDWLYVFYRSGGSSEIHYRVLGGRAPGESWRPENHQWKVNVSRTSHTPKVVFFHDKLYLVYKGKNNNIYFRSAVQNSLDKSLIFGKESEINGVETDIDPSICVFDYAFDKYFFMFYKQKGSKIIYFKWFEIE